MAGGVASWIAGRAVGVSLISRAAATPTFAQYRLVKEAASMTALFAHEGGQQGRLWLVPVGARAMAYPRIAATAAGRTRVRAESRPTPGENLPSLLDLSKRIAS